MLYTSDKDPINSFQTKKQPLFIQTDLTTKLVVNLQNSSYPILQIILICMQCIINSLPKQEFK